MPSECRRPNEPPFPARHLHEGRLVSLCPLLGGTVSLGTLTSALTSIQLPGDGPGKVSHQPFVTLSPEKTSMSQMHDDTVSSRINWPGFLAEE